jgi:hypothetical protein
MLITILALAAACLAVRATVAPSFANPSAFPGERLNTVTGCPWLSNRPAMPDPMIPNPNTAIDILSAISPPRSSHMICKHGACEQQINTPPPPLRSTLRQLIAISNKTNTRRELKRGRGQLINPQNKNSTWDGFYSVFLIFPGIGMMTISRGQRWTVGRIKKSAS